MSNETKRDVLVNAVDALADAQASSDNNVGLGHQDADLFMAEYEKALPDNLPVIPKEVGEYLKWCKKYDVVLFDALDVVDFAGGVPPDEIMFWMSEEVEQSLRAYIWHNEDTFALAWVLGVWRVEETDEIVKLEEEK